MSTELTRCRRAVAANAVLQRRDYAFCLYPEATLRPFMTQSVVMVRRRPARQPAQGILCHCHLPRPLYNIRRMARKAAPAPEESTPWTDSSAGRAKD